MRFTVVTWNVNSVRLREQQVLRLLAEVQPDVLCLQELKSPIEKIPAQSFADAGYPHLVARGQKAYNGVAILAREEIEDAGAIDFCDGGDARHVAARTVSGMLIHNFYVPAGGDVPDPDENPKFDHKLRFVDEMRERFDRPTEQTVMVGDLNIAPMEHDVWSHKELLKVVSHTPIEVEKFEQTRSAGDWIDVSRRFVPEEEKLYSWWSYRAKDWAASDRGRRLDHIWASPDLDGALTGSTILKETRGWEKPSDHAPVVAVFDL